MIPLNSFLPPLPIWRAAVVLTALGMLAYFNALSAAFIFDDLYFVRVDQLRNPLMSELIANRPVIALSLSLNYLLDGLNPRGYHFLNLLTHVLGATLLFDLVRRILLQPAWVDRYAARAEVLAFAIAALWLVHPLQTQSVTYMIQRCESMMGLFYLLSLWSVVRLANSSCKRSWAVLAYLAAALSCGCKEVAVSIPVVAILMDRAFLSQNWRSLLRERWGFYLGLGLVTMGCIYLTVFARGAIFTGQGAAGFGLSLYTPTTYALTQTQVIFYYLRLCFWPAPLCLDYLDWPIAKTFFDAWKTAVPLALIVFATLVTTAIRPSWGFLAITFLLILAPTSTIVPIQDALFEHRLYLSLAALITGVVLLVDRGLQWVQQTNGEAALALHRLALLVLVAVIGLFTLRTIQRNSDYSSMLRMYTDVVAKRPENFRGHSNLGWALLGQGNYQAALYHAEKALSYQPANPNYLHGMAAALFDAGNAAAAWRTLSKVEKFTEAAGIVPELPLTAAKILVVQNRPAEALTYLDLSRQTLPNDVRNELFSGMALLQLQRHQEARQQFDALLKQKPEYYVELNSLARTTAFLPTPNPTQLRIARLSVEAACLMTEEQNADCLDTLAIVLATEAALLRARPYQQAAMLGGVAWRPVPEAGKLFAEAESRAIQASNLAREQGQAYLASRITLRAELFRSQSRYLGR